MKLQGGVQGVLVMEKESKKMVDEAVTSTTASLKRKALIHDSDSDDDMPLSSKLKISKEVVDTTTASLVDPLKPKKRKRLIKSRYHIPLKVQILMIFHILTSHLILTDYPILMEYQILMKHQILMEGQILMHLLLMAHQ